MVKAVVFDLGKVLVDFDYMIAARRLAARSKMSPERLMAVLVRSSSFIEYERGRVTRRELFNEICRATGFNGSLEEFALFFSDIFAEIKPMVELHAELRNRGFATYVFSNTNDLAVEHLRRAFPFFGNFDGYIFSYEHGVLKPEAGLYEVLERQSGRRAGELLYLDDRLENTQAGAARGWEVILHESPEKSQAAIRGLGLLP
ncbi:MAG: HAD family phosphatase [Verrucomicrobiota bacterium]|jgi:putative hydrolase of the HAD superfamily